MHKVGLPDKIFYSYEALGILTKGNLQLSKQPQIMFQVDICSDQQIALFLCCTLIMRVNGYI